MQQLAEVYVVLIDGVQVRRGLRKKGIEAVRAIDLRDFRTTSAGMPRKRILQTPYRGDS